jgi:citrate synthase
MGTKQEIYSLDKSSPQLKELCEEYRANNRISPKDYELYNVKRGLRNPDGTGVMAGLTLICNVHGYLIADGERIPDEGKLTYRGIDINEIVDGCVRENRFGFEEVAWLLLFGKLPTREQLDHFTKVLSSCRELPEYFAEDMIIKAPSKNVMNKLARSVLALYSYDDNPDDPSLENNMRQSIQLIARLPTIMTYAYQVKRRHYDKQSMYFHPIDPSQSTAESILNAIRPDRVFTDEEAKLLDICMMIHAEHGGGNNSTFATRALSSTGTDIYSAIAAGIGSLKGPRHGGANHRVMMMMNELMEQVKDWKDEDEVAAYLEKILRGEACDHSGLIYGMGHAVYTLSDPRAVILRSHAKKLASEKECSANLSFSSLLRSSPRKSLPRLRARQRSCVQMWISIPASCMRCSESPAIFTHRFSRYPASLDGARTVSKKCKPAEESCVLPIVPLQRTDRMCPLQKDKAKDKAERWEERCL